MGTKETDKEISGFSSADSHKDGADPAPQGWAPGSPAGKPLLLIDIDGVISLFCGWGPSSGAIFAGRAGSFHSIDGMPHFLSATAAAHLLDLQPHFELVWCSGWEEKANEHLPHLLGLPPSLPFLRFERSVGRANAHWKLAAIDDFAGDRPLAWIDDALNEACHEWARARPAPTLLVQTEPEHGLTHREAELLSRWAAELRAAAG
ncbi:MAG: HAD domain-containing protein [Solirubrobacterales bacterium]